MIDFFSHGQQQEAMSISYLIVLSNILQTVLRFVEASVFRMFNLSLGTLIFLDDIVSDSPKAQLEASPPFSGSNTTFGRSTLALSISFVGGNGPPFEEQRFRVLALPLLAHPYFGLRTSPSGTSRRSLYHQAQRKGHRGDHLPRRPPADQKSRDSTA